MRVSRSECIGVQLIKSLANSEIE
ncbi:uncharacterized protein METZ01_LOCUS179132, partial [marine metagenome]